jgi:hypothetical protein
MWQLAAESLSRFPSVIVTALSNEQYPVSIRQRPARYDPRTGEMPVLIPASVVAMPGPANVLAHHHDENLSDLQMMQIKGRLERHDGEWVFVTTAFRPPPRGRFAPRWQMAKAMRRASGRYLATRGLRRPKVNWAAIKRLQQQAQLDRRNAS